MQGFRRQLDGFLAPARFSLGAIKPKYEGTKDLFQTPAASFAACRRVWPAEMVVSVEHNSEFILIHNTAVLWSRRRENSGLPRIAGNSRRRCR